MGFFLRSFNFYCRVLLGIKAVEISKCGSYGGPAVYWGAFRFKHHPRFTTLFSPNLHRPQLLLSKWQCQYILWPPPSSR